MEAGEILRNSEMWLRTCDASRKAGIPASALYSLEMAVEMALKAVLCKLGIEVPKSHNVTNQIREVARHDARIPKEFRDKIDKIADTFSLLVEYRAPSGYSFEYNFTEKELKGKLDDLYDDSREIIELCREAVSSP